MSRLRRIAIALAIAIAAARVARPAEVAGPERLAGPFAVDTVGRAKQQAGACLLMAAPGAERALARLAPEAGPILAQVERQLGTMPRAPYTIVLFPERMPRDRDLVALDRGAPPWAAGYMNPGSRTGGIRLVQAARYPYGTPEAVLAHESAHLILHDVPGFDAPLWFEEGVATWVARDWQLEDQVLLSGRLMTRAQPRLAELADYFTGDPDHVEEAYAASFAFIEWSAKRYGDGFVAELVRASRTHSFERAWIAATGERLEHAETAWRHDCAIRYRWVPIVAATSPLWLFVLALSEWVWARKRRQALALRAAWEGAGAPDAEELPWDEGSAASDAPHDSTSD